MAEITRKSVLLECLSIMREEQRIMSKNYNCLEPAKGMEEAWEQGREKIRILEEHIQALDSEPVLKALANWQMEEKPPKDIAEEFRARGIPNDLENKTTDPIFLKSLATVDKEALLTGEWEKARESLDHEDGTMELR